jgi:hypothetical protein
MASAANAPLWRLTAKNADIIVPLGGQGGGFPFYCVHSISGEAHTLRAASWHPSYLWNSCRNLPYWLENTLAESDRKRCLLQKAQKRMRRVSASGPGSNVEKFLDTSVWPEAQSAFVRSLFDIVERYEAKPYLGPLLVFAAKAQHLFRAGQVELTWKQISKSAEVIKVDGSHVTMLRKPRVANLANTLRERLVAFDQRAQHAELPPTLENAAGAGIETERLPRA